MRGPWPRVQDMASSRVITVRPTDSDSVPAEALRTGITAIQQEMGLSVEFPPQVEKAAAAAAAAPRLPGY